mgnify:CR=1 FL=1
MNEEVPQSGVSSFFCVYDERDYSIAPCHVVGLFSMWTGCCGDSGT